MNTNTLKQETGENAGLIWHILNDKREIKLNDLKELSELSVEDFYMALGWLKREDKIFFYENENSLMICLLF